MTEWLLNAITNCFLFLVLICVVVLIGGVLIFAVSCIIKLVFALWIDFSN